MQPLLLVTFLAVFLAIAYCQRPMMGRPDRPPQRNPSRPVNSRPNNSLNTTDQRQTVSVNGPALLFGIAGLAAVAGTAGFIGGLILGENDPGFNRRRRPPFRGKRTTNVHHQVSKSCENEEALLFQLNILENKQLNTTNNNNEDNDGCNFFRDCCSQFVGNNTTQFSE